MRAGTRLTMARLGRTLRQGCKAARRALASDEWRDLADPYGAIEFTTWGSYVRRLIAAGAVEKSGTGAATRYRPAGLKWSFEPLKLAHPPKPCMLCRADFPSAGKYHRICDTCRRGPDWNNPAYRGGMHA